MEAVQITTAASLSNTASFALLPCWSFTLCFVIFSPVKSC
ncbi:unnamed protein product [Linum tenue]|nr:unnamed protein product [Linum tenue]